MNVLKETISGCWYACASVLKMKVSWKCSFRNFYSIPFYSTSLLLVDLLSIPGWKRRWTLLLKLCNNLSSKSCNHIYSSSLKNLTRIWLSIIGTIWLKKKLLSKNTIFSKIIFSFRMKKKWKWMSQEMWISTLFLLLSSCVASGKSLKVIEFRKRPEIVQSAWYCESFS